MTRRPSVTPGSPLRLQLKALGSSLKHVRSGPACVARARARNDALVGLRDEAGEQMPLGVPMSQLGRGGVGVELYFRTLRYFCVLFSIASFLGVALLVNNVGSTPPSSASGGAILACALGYWEERTDGLSNRSAALQLGVWLAVDLIAILHLIWLRQRQHVVARSVDLRFVTAADFAVELRGLPIGEQFLSPSWKAPSWKKRPPNERARVVPVEELARGAEGAEGATGREHRVPGVPGLKSIQQGSSFTGLAASLRDYRWPASVVGKVRTPRAIVLDEKEILSCGATKGSRTVSAGATVGVSAGAAAAAAAGAGAGAAAGSGPSGGRQPFIAAAAPAACSAPAPAVEDEADAEADAEEAEATDGADMTGEPAARNPTNRANGTPANAPGSMSRSRSEALELSSALRAFCEQFGQVHHVGLALRCARYLEHLNYWNMLSLARAELQARLGVGPGGGQNGGTGGARRRRAQPMPLVFATEAARAQAFVSLDELELALASCETELAQIWAERVEPVGVAFVAFETEAGRRACLHALRAESSVLGASFSLFGRAERSRFSRLASAPRFNAAPDRSMPGVVLSAHPAPEPSDVLWGNLEVSSRAQRRISLMTACVSVGLVGTSASVLVFVGRRLRDDKEQLQTARSRLGSARYETDLVLQGIALGEALFVKAIEVLIYQTLKALARAECHHTHTAHAQSQFSKLALASVANQALLVFFVSFLVSEPPYQSAWFRPGGLATQVFWIAVTNAAVAEIARALQLHRQAWRLVASRLATSQKALDAAWMPRTLGLGEMYASLARLVAIGLIYGPMQPLVWPLTALGCVITFWANKYQLLRTAIPPASVNFEVSERFRGACTVVIGAAIGMQVALLPAKFRLLLLVPGIPWLLVALLPLERLPGLGSYRDVYSDDTGGQKFSELRSLPRYVCPIVLPLPSRPGDELSRAHRAKSVAEEERASVAAAQAERAAAAGSSFFGSLRNGLPGKQQDAPATEPMAPTTDGANALAPALYTGGEQEQLHWEERTVQTGSAREQHQLAGAGRTLAAQPRPQVHNRVHAPAAVMQQPQPERSGSRSGMVATEAAAPPERAAKTRAVHLQSTPEQLRVVSTSDDEGGPAA